MQTPAGNDPGHGSFRFDANGSRTFRRLLDQLGLRSMRTLDIGCGFGEHLICFGEGSLGITTTPEEAEFGRAKGVPIVLGNAETVDKIQGLPRFQAIWANNLFEHLLAPHAFLIKLKAISDPDTLLVLGVPVIPRIASLMRLPRFRGALASLHINFFTRESLTLTVERAGWKIQAVRPFISSVRLIDEYVLSFFAPHLYVVAHNDASFRYPGKKLKEWKDDGHYDELIAIVGSGHSI